jgi:hypothetical protein
MSRLINLASTLGGALALASVALSSAALAAQDGRRGADRGAARVQQQSVPQQSRAAASVRQIERNFYPSNAGGVRSLDRGNRGGGGGGIAHNPGRHYNGHQGENRRHHGRRNTIIYAVPSYDDYAYSSGDDDCRYYWRRYQRTGNPIWKYRYYDCIE